MSATDFTRGLIADHVGYELIPHRRTATAREEALEVGLGEVAKTIVVASGDGLVRTVIPAAERLDLGKVRAALHDGKDVRLVTEGELAGAYPMFDLGAVPPIGGPPGDRLLVDARVAARESVVFEAGSHESSVRMETKDVIRLGAAVVVDICKS